MSRVGDALRRHARAAAAHLRRTEAQAPTRDDSVHTVESMRRTAESMREAVDAMMDQHEERRRLLGDMLARRDARLEDFRRRVVSDMARRENETFGSMQASAVIVPWVAAPTPEAVIGTTGPISREQARALARPEYVNLYSTAPIPMTTGFDYSTGLMFGSGRSLRMERLPGYDRQFGPSNLRPAYRLGEYYDPDSAWPEQRLGAAPEPQEDKPLLEKAAPRVVRVREEEAEEAGHD